MRRLTFVALLVGLAVCSWALPAGADAAYHASHLPLHATGSAPLRSGFVENIHANGPTVYAHENYIVNGADIERVVPGRALHLGHQYGMRGNTDGRDPDRGTHHKRSWQRKRLRRLPSRGRRRPAWFDSERHVDPHNRRIGRLRDRLRGNHTRLATNGTAS